MRLSKRGKPTSISVENITPFGIWLFVQGKEYFLSYEEYPYFRDQTLGTSRPFSCSTTIICTGRNWMSIWKSIISNTLRSTRCNPQ